MQGFLQTLNKGVRYKAAAMSFVLFMTSTVAQAGWFHLTTQLKASTRLLRSR